MKTNKSCSLCNMCNKLINIDYKKYAKFLILIPIILLAFSVIITYFFGLNYATELKNKYEFTVDFGKEMLEENIDDYKQKINNALGENNLESVSFSKYGASLYTGFVVTISPETSTLTEEQLTEVKESIETYLQTNISDAVEVGDIAITESNITSFVTTALIALAVAMVAVFVYFWIRFTLTHAVAGAFLTIFSTLLTYIIYGLFRLPFGYNALAVIFAGLIFSLLIYVFTCDKIKSMELNGEKLTNNEFIAKANTSIINGLLCPVSIILCIVLVIAIALIFINIYVASILFAIILASLVSIYSTLYATNSLWVIMYNIEKDNRLKARIDRINNKKEKKAKKQETEEKDKVLV